MLCTSWMCDIDHRRWSRMMLSLGGPTLKNLSVGTLITIIFKVYLISMFQHGSSNPVHDSSHTIVNLY